MSKILNILIHPYWDYEDTVSKRRPYQDLYLERVKFFFEKANKNKDHKEHFIMVSPGFSTSMKNILLSLYLNINHEAKTGNRNYIEENVINHEITQKYLKSFNTQLLKRVKKRPRSSYRRVLFPKGKKNIKKGGLPVSKKNINFFLKNK